MSLNQYHNKRDFKVTGEPKGKLSRQHSQLFVIQKHAASHLHYDFRLELGGVLLSWAVPKGPCLDPSVKRLSMQVEDHPVAYGSFEGIIPQGQYGGGTVMIWDTGVWIPLDENPAQSYEKGHLRFELDAKKLKGRWDLIRFKKEGQWFLIKYADEYAKPLSRYDVLVEKPDSAVSNHTMEKIAQLANVTIPKKKSSAIIKHKKYAMDDMSTLLPKQLSKAPFPDKVNPQLATLVDKAPDGEEWLHEVKFDGYRILAFINNNSVTLKSRNHNDWTQRFASVATALKHLGLKQVIFDGEVVLLNNEGKSDFQLLQNAIKHEPDSPFIYYIFDILYYDHFDLKPLPLLQRKTILASLLKNEKNILRYSDHIFNEGEQIFQRSCELGLEGIISKQVNASYQTKRSKSWLKVKCTKRQEFVIGGFSRPQGQREYFGALHLGTFNADKDLVYAGKVGTGFSAASLKEIYHLLQQHIVKQSPFNSKIPASSTVTWINPVLIADIEFSEWTDDGHLRHPSFKGMRMDKKINPSQLTHADKILYPEDGISKQALWDYYETVSDYMLPFIKNRPLSLLRCPHDFNECFFQRHYTSSTSQDLKPVAIAGKEGDEQYIYLNNKKGLLSLVQMGVLEIHPWGSVIAHVEQPDYLVIDLDPAPDVGWKEIVNAAFDVKLHLEKLKLNSFVKTTGGKGLHVVVPFKPEYDWEEVSHFSHVFVKFLAQLQPDRYITTMSKAKRQGKIFLDYLRNKRSATAIAPYSTRARVHAPVSVPIHWDELREKKEDIEFTIRTLPQRLLSLTSDPWKTFYTLKQSLCIHDLDL